MLIYNKNLSVSPITTHIPIKKVSTSITRRKIIINTILIKKFYKNKFKKNARIAITGLTRIVKVILLIMRKKNN